MYSVCIPLRHGVSHAAARREFTDSVIVAVEFMNGVTGYGETLPREYVTGEFVESVKQAVRDVFVPAMLSFHPNSFPEALEAIESLPWTDGDRAVPAARAAVELALLDATLRGFRRTMDDVVRWMGLPGLGRLGGRSSVRYSGVLAAESVASTLRHLRMMYWGGLRQYKIKVGTEGDDQRLPRVAAYLRRSLDRGRVTLRADANAAWTKEAAVEWLTRWRDLPLEALEQPLPKGSECDLPSLKKAHSIPLIHDESLVTIDDARRLIDLGVADAFNIRISKCGGMLPSLHIAALARRHGVDIQLGSMVGETAILSAAGVRFLQVCPGVRWAEGCYGTYLLERDVASHPLRFGCGGRQPRLADPGLGVNVDVNLLQQACPGAPEVFNF